jgi:hypothetical protein
LRQKLPDLNKYQHSNPIKIFPGKKLLQFCLQHNRTNPGNRILHIAQKRGDEHGTHPTEERPKWRTAWTTDSPRIPMPIPMLRKQGQHSACQPCCLVPTSVADRRAFRPGQLPSVYTRGREREREREREVVEVVGVVVMMMV